MSISQWRIRENRRAGRLGAAAMLTGFCMMAIAFPGTASAGEQAARSAAGCGVNSWTDTVTVSNSPTASDGVAVISGTGTALDGQHLAAGGGQQTLRLTEPFSVATVTVSGVLTWPARAFTAPFTTTARQPSSCGRAALLTAAAAASSTPNTPSVTLCHGTNSNTNPYVQITVDAAGAFNGHLGHTGPIWDPSLKAQHIQWGDIIPPFVFNGNTFSLNWTPIGIAFWNNGCNIPSTITQTATATVTSPGPTVTVTGPTQTVTVTASSTVTVTRSGSATVTIPGPTTTVSVPGPTVTLTATATDTQTATVTDTATVTNQGTSGTVTVTVAGPVTTVTVTQSLAGATSTVTETVAQTVIVSPSASVLGVSVERVLVTSTVTKFNCPPGAAVQGGSLAYTGGGNDATMSLLGGALTAGGAVFLLMPRKRRPARTH
jgi:hypothetical protein